MNKKIKLFLVVGAGVIGIGILILLLSAAMNDSKKERDKIIETLLSLIHI